MKLKCEYCGKEFESKRFQKFCSVECAGKHKAKKIKCKCANCHCRIHIGGLIVDDDIKKKKEFINDI